MPKKFYVTQTSSQPSPKGMKKTFTFFLTTFSEPYKSIVPTQTDGNKMNKIIYFYTIYWKSFPTQYRPSEIESLSIAYSENNVPKDRFDHHDAVLDYLIDTNPNPFESVPEFIIIKTTTEQ